MFSLNAFPNIALKLELRRSNRLPKDDESYHALLRIEAVNGVGLERLRQRVSFEDGIPVFPTDRFRLETSEEDVSTRVFDLVCPIEKGQRALIVAPPKAGKTTLLKQLANAIIANHPEVLMLILLMACTTVMMMVVFVVYCFQQCHQNFHLLNVIKW